MKIKFGQFKVPFDREFLVSGYGLQLVERSIANAEFSLQHDIGIQVSGERILNTIAYRVGIFNGSGANQNNLDNEYLFTSRLVWTPLGNSYPYWQAALDTPDELQLAFGVDAAYLPDLESGERAKLAGKLGDSQIVPVSSDITQYTLDIALKYKLFSFEGGQHYRNIKPKETTPFGDQEANGLYIQSGYFVIPEKIELSTRYSGTNPDNPETINNNEKKEITFGGSYYLSGHKAKAQLNYSLISSDIPSGDEDQHAILTTMCLQF